MADFSRAIFSWRNGACKYSENISTPKYFTLMVYVCHSYGHLACGLEVASVAIPGQ